eukprot:4036350-Alexandrium_andersonii.AAC.1
MVSWEAAVGKRGPPDRTQRAKGDSRSEGSRCARGAGRTTAGGPRESPSIWTPEVRQPRPRRATE